MRLNSSRQIDHELSVHVESPSVYVFLPPGLKDVSILYLLLCSRSFVPHIDQRPLGIPDPILDVRVLRVWGASFDDVSSCEVLREIHKYVGCVLRSEREELFLWWISLWYPQRFTEIAFVRFLTVGNLTTTTVRRETVHNWFKHLWRLMW